jgi:ABC-type lipoprotein release transport system permease subunit
VLLLALRNIRHYRGRTITTVALSFVATALFVLYVALMDGSHESMLKNSLSIYTAPIQVMCEGYRESPTYEYLIEHVDSVEQAFMGIEGVLAMAQRLESFALLSTDRDSVGAMVTGIEPEEEARVSKLKAALHEGRYLVEHDGDLIYLGADLAQRLDVEVGDTVALIGSAVDYSFAAQNFTVIGTFRTGYFDFDVSSAFVSKSAFDTLMLSDDIASSIALGLSDIEQADRVASRIAGQLPKGIEAVTWKVLMGSMVQAMQVDSLFGYVSMGLFFLVIFFVLMIYGLINVGTRIREFGLLQALGLRAWDITHLLLLETTILTLASVIPGMVAGGIAAYYFSVDPITIEGISETYKSYGVVSDEIPTRFDLLTIFWNALVIVLLNFAALLYPIAYLRGFTPIKALRHVW